MLLERLKRKPWREQSLRLLLLLLTCAPLTESLVAQLMNRAWTQPYRLSGEGDVALFAAMVADGSGRTHAFWSETIGPPPLRSSSLRYARFDGEVWSEPVDIHVTEIPVTIGYVSAALDRNGRFQLVWTEADTQFIGFPCCGPVFHSSAPAEDALDPTQWSPPRPIPVPAMRLSVRADSGRLHLLFSRIQPPDLGVYHMWSDDDGVTWTDPFRLDPDIPAQHRPDVIQFETDGAGNLHAVWHYTDDENGFGDQIRYARSLDGGLTWSVPFTLDQAESETQELRLPYPGLAVRGQTVHAVWAGGGVINVGRRHRYSQDGGSTWSEVAQLFGDLHGQSNGDGLVANSDGRLNFLGQIRWPQGLYRADWKLGRWSSPQLVYLIAENFEDPPGERIHAHGTRMTQPSDGQLVSTFTTAPVFDPIVNLYTMHVRRPILYFPHYGVGAGLSVQFSISNPTDEVLAGVLKIYDSSGNTQQLMFEGGAASEIEFELAPNGTRVLVAHGPDAGVLSGYAKVEAERSGLVGFSIFQFDSGLEASVPSVRPNRRFALFAEESDTLSTGIAVLRRSPRPVQLSLYDLEGQLVDSGELDLPNEQRAVFLNQVFSLPAEGFRGLLVLESDGDFAPLGLRFGPSVLSTIEVVDLDDGLALTYFLPHYGDGQGLSMLFANSNLSNGPATAGLTFFDADGNIQELPLRGGGASGAEWNASPKSTFVVETDGSSQPPRSGYVRVSWAGGAAVGFGIFKFQSGLEASVFPSALGKRFGVFVERSSRLDTGIALLQPGAEPIKLSLYDESGRLVASRLHNADHRQSAQFLSQLFAIPESFRGFLKLESETAFAVLGLRFGAGVLSTTPAQSLDFD